MIDLDKLIQWALIAFGAGSLVLITHLLTLQMAFQEFQRLSADIHEQTVEISEVSDFPIPRGNSLDSLALIVALSQFSADLSCFRHSRSHAM